jgi:Flp pilus assembly protein TadG
MSKQNRLLLERGNAMVEMALTLSLFLTSIFSLFDFGWVLFYHQTLVHQARTAARYGALNPGDLTGAQNMAIWSQTAQGTPARAILGLQPANVLVSRNGQGTNSDMISVTISGYRYVLITFGWAGAHTGKPITVTMPVEN